MQSKIHHFSLIIIQQYKPNSASNTNMHLILTQYNDDIIRINHCSIITMPTIRRNLPWPAMSVMHLGKTFAACWATTAMGTVKLDKDNIVRIAGPDMITPTLLQLLLISVIGGGA